MYTIDILFFTLIGLVANINRLYVEVNLFCLIPVSLSIFLFYLILKPVNKINNKHSSKNSSKNK